VLFIAICFGFSEKGGIFAFPPRILRNSLHRREDSVSRFLASGESGGREWTFPP
jgi:hypothetical protein